MNEVRIKISRLGAITDAEVVVRPFMLFVGNSGLGKSYVAFLTHYIYTILGSNRLEEYFKQFNYDELLNGKKSGDIILRVKVQDIFNWINQDAITFIGYMIGHEKFSGKVDIKWPFSDEYIEFSYFEEMGGLTNKEELIYRIKAKNYSYSLLGDTPNIGAYVFETLFRAELSASIFGSFKNFPQDYILPSSRGALMELQGNPVFKSGMYEQFISLKSELYRTPITKEKEEDPILTDILDIVNNGRLSQSDNNIIYTTLDGVEMPLTAAASSVKELAPFTMLLNRFNLSRTSILLDEPEAHLHPERQQHVADLIGYTLSRGCHMQITTHSDYFIKRLNLLIKLFKIYKQNKKDISLILKKLGIYFEALIDPDMIKAYYLTQREDKSSQIFELDVLKDSMIPFDSFHKTIMSDFESVSIIDEYIDNI